MRGTIRAIAIIVGLWTMLLSPAAAQELGALARLTGPVTVSESWRTVSLRVPISQPVAWRTRLLTDPPRALVDFRTLDWTGLVLPESFPAPVAGLRVGDAGGGWSRLVIDLSEPAGFDEAGLSVDAETGQAVLDLTLSRRDADDFAAQAAALAATDGAVAGASASGPARAPIGLRPTVVVIDPGHGGVDPGAVHGGVAEAALMLAFARELAAELRRTGRYEVVLTRDADTFVSLEGRISVSHEAGADVFLSLHADAVTDGQAYGATIYTLADEATDAAAAALAERHERDEIIGGGVDLSGSDDAVAAVLMELTRAETGPATDRLARALVSAIQGAELRMHRFPWQQAAFSVLKSASVPSALLELGFLSSERDRTRLSDPEWRGRMIGALVAGLNAWVLQEAETAALLRR